MPFTKGPIKQYNKIHSFGAYGMNMNRFLDGGQVTLLKKTFRQLNTDEFATYFYEKLFEFDPDLKGLFTRGMDEQKLKLISVFELVIFSFEEKEKGRFSLEESLLIPLRQLGIFHEERGIQPSHYQVANDLLVDTMEYCLGKNYNSEIKVAWLLALDHLTYAMLNTNLQTGKFSKKDSLLSVREMFRDILQKLRRADTKLNLF